MIVHKQNTLKIGKNQSTEVTEDEVEELLNNVKDLGSKKADKNVLQYLCRKEEYYPVIPVENKYLLLAVDTKNFKGLIWLSNWFEIDSAYRDKSNAYHIKLKVNGKIVDVGYDMLCPKEIVKLSKYGIIVSFDYADKLSQYIFKVLLKCEVREQFHGMGFFTQDEKLTFRAYGEQEEILQCTENTSIFEYVNQLNKLLTNQAIMFALCCSCASLFLAYLSIQCGIALQSFIISFYGKSTTGKSTAQTLMASVYTNPNDKKIYIPFFGTLNAIVKNFANKFGVPQLFDEATVASGLNMESLLYTITLEQDKSRCNTNADLRVSDTWKLIAVTSSENRLLADSSMHNKGLDARLLSFELKFTDSGKHSDDIHEFCHKNYGILGKALSEYLLSAEPETIVGMYEECRGTIKNSIGEEMYFDLTERLINEYALILLASRVLADFGVITDDDSIIAIIKENHNEIRNETDIAEKYYQHLLTYLATHPYSDNIKKDEENNTAAFVDEIFLKILEDHGASNTGLVIRELDSAGYMFRRKKNAMKNRLRFNGTLVNCYEIILPKADSESDDDCMTLEYILTHFEGVDES